MKFKDYKKIDIIVFTILMIFSSLSSRFLLSNSRHFYFSFTTLLLFITMVRWNYLGILPYVISSIVTCIVEIYVFKIAMDMSIASCIGGCLFLGIIPLVMNKNLKENFREKPLRMMMILLSTFIVIDLGKSLALLLVCQYNFLNSFIYLLLRQEIFSIVLSFILILLLNKSDNLIVDVKMHIKNLQNEEEEDTWKGLEEKIPSKKS